QLLSFFFFSSRRRHTRFSRDWSSDVCSSDLKMPEQLRRIVVKEGQEIKIIPLEEVLFIEAADDYAKVTTEQKYYLKHQRMSAFRSEERRVGKEGRWRGSARRRGRCSCEQESG